MAEKCAGSGYSGNACILRYRLRANCAKFPHCYLGFKSHPCGKAENQNSEKQTRENQGNTSKTTNLTDNRYYVNSLGYKYT